MFCTFKMCCTGDVLHLKRYRHRHLSDVNGPTTGNRQPWHTKIISNRLIHLYVRNGLDVFIARPAAMYDATARHIARRKIPVHDTVLRQISI
jgi:hypothetical protein